jgi:hypothetical protein
MLHSMQSAHALCEPMGLLEYVVESRHDGRLDTWYVVRPDSGQARRYRALGLPITSGCRVVIEAQSMQPVGVLESELPEAPLPAGYNPYFDLPPA